MTEGRRAKRAIRSRMAETGEKYTQARRTLLGGESGQPPHDSVPESAEPSDPIGRFTDQAYNAILLAEDEARMLSQPTVEPEHLLLAAARRGNLEQLLAREGVSASAIHAVLVGLGGFGEDLVVGPVPRSTHSEVVLQQAIAAAAKRGIQGPSTEHLLLGLAGQDRAVIVLRQLGISNPAALVDAKYPVTRPPLDPDAVKRLARTAAVRKPPSPGPIPPVFERFSAEAHETIDAAVQSAGSLGSQYVTPAHLLLAVLGSQKGVVASVRPRHKAQFDAALRHASELMSRHSTTARQIADDVTDRRARVSTAPTGIFTVPARHLVAEQVLGVAHRFGHQTLGTGHLLLAILENPDETSAAVLEAWPDPRQIASEVIQALPGDEHT